MNYIHISKLRQRVNSVKKHREKYLGRLQEINETRLEVERQNNEMRERILEKIAIRNKSAEKVRLALFEKHKFFFIEERNKTLKFKRNLNNLKELNKQSRKRLLKKVEQQDQRLRMLKLQKRELEALRDRIGEEIRQHKIIRVDNLYELLNKSNIL
jgi:hypothetical protein